MAVVFQARWPKSAIEHHVKTRFPIYVYMYSSAFQMSQPCESYTDLFTLVARAHSHTVA